MYRCRLSEKLGLRSAPQRLALREKSRGQFRFSFECSNESNSDYDGMSSMGNPAGLLYQTCPSL